MNKNLWQRFQEWFVKQISHVKWKQRSELTDDDKAVIREMLVHDYYVIATRRRNFLSSFCICLGHFILTGRWGFYTHVLMNMEDEVHSDSDFKLIEATTKGTKFSTFEQVFSGVDAVALLKPVSMTVKEWTACMDKAKEQLGKPYDNLFNIMNDSEVNCVELVRIALMALPDYNTRFANFEKMISKKKFLTPQMFVECPDFHIYFTVKR
jgi:hypothetical protein